MVCPAMRLDAALIGGAATGGVRPSRYHSMPASRVATRAILEAPLPGLCTGGELVTGGL